MLNNSQNNLFVLTQTGQEGLKQAASPLTLPEKLVLTRARKPISRSDLYNHSKQDSATFEIFFNKLLSWNWIAAVDTLEAEAKTETFLSENEDVATSESSASIQAEIAKLFGKLEANQKELKNLAVENQTNTELHITQSEQIVQQSEFAEISDIDIGIHFDLPTDTEDFPSRLEKAYTTELDSIPAPQSDDASTEAPTDTASVDARLQYQILTLRRLRLQVAKQERERAEILAYKQRQKDAAELKKKQDAEKMEQIRKDMAHKKANRPDNLAAKLQALAAARQQK